MLRNNNQNSELDFSIRFTLFEFGNPLRLSTVIYGIPFYESSGENSGQKGTWFPYLGISSKNWIKKPKLPKQLPEEIHYLCSCLNIDKAVNIGRFGSLLTMCLSASIGGGFWETEKGSELKRILHSTYPQYFLKKEMVSDLLKAKHQNHEPLKNPMAVNSRLKELSVIVPVDSKTARLPYHTEFEFIQNQNENIRLALSELLTKPDPINQETYQSLIQQNIIFEIKPFNFKKLPLVMLNSLFHFSSIKNQDFGIKQTLTAINFRKR